MSLTRRACPPEGDRSLRLEGLPHAGGGWGGGASKVMSRRHTTRARSNMVRGGGGSCACPPEGERPRVRSLRLKARTAALWRALRRALALPPLPRAGGGGASWKRHLGLHLQFRQFGVGFRQKVWAESVGRGGAPAPKWCGEEGADVVALRPSAVLALASGTCPACGGERAFTCHSRSPPPWVVGFAVILYTYII